MYQYYHGLLERRQCRAYSTIHVEHVVRFLDRVDGDIVDTAGNRRSCVSLTDPSSPFRIALPANSTNVRRIFDISLNMVFILLEVNVGDSMFMFMFM